MLQIGADYYPEQCSESCWPTDVALMNEAGVSIVRMAEFAWSRMEPAEGQYAFEWLDRILDLLHQGGIQAVLGTPTATPPAWLHARYPDIYPMDQRKYRLGFGIREQRCLNNDNMRAYGQRIIEAMARRYAEHPAVVGWQIDNELSANLCYCPICHEKFHVWLQGKYNTLDALNQAWGASFWSQEYSDWAQIPLPWHVKGGVFHNPSLQLEFRRFQSQATIDFEREQIALLRRLAPRHFITHNMMGLHNSLDCYELGKELDFVSWDNYPITPWGESPFGSPLAADVMRGIKQRNVWVMEQINGITGWNTMGRRPSGEWLRCAAWQAVAHGADAVVFFRWRTACYGTEQFWHGVINHDGVPRRRFREVAAFGKEIQQFAPMLDGTAPRSEVAIVNAYEQHFAMDIQPQAEGLGIWDQAAHYYRALQTRGLNVDVVPLSAGLNAYKLVIAPSWYILTPEDAACFIDYVQQGGTLILSPRTGVKNADNACYEAPLPSLLRELAGVEVDDYDALGKDESSIQTAGGQKYATSVWADLLQLHGADAIAWHAGSVFTGEPAITRHHYGSGAAYYFGVFAEPALYDALLGRILEESEIQGLMELPEGMEAAWREKDKQKYLFLMNFNDSERTAAVPGGLTALLGNAPENGSITLPAYGVGLYECAMNPHGIGTHQTQTSICKA